MLLISGPVVHIGMLMYRYPPPVALVGFCITEGVFSVVAIVQWRNHFRNKMPLTKLDGGLPVPTKKVRKVSPGPFRSTHARVSRTIAVPVDPPDVGTPSGLNGR